MAAARQTCIFFAPTSERRSGLGIPGQRAGAPARLQCVSRFFFISSLHFAWPIGSNAFVRAFWQLQLHTHKRPDAECCNNAVINQRTSTEAMPCGRCSFWRIECCRVPASAAKAKWRDACVNFAQGARLPASLRLPALCHKGQASARRPADTTISRLVEHSRAAAGGRAAAMQPSFAASRPQQPLVGRLAARESRWPCNAAAVLLSTPLCLA